MSVISQSKSQLRRVYLEHARAKGEERTAPADAYEVAAPFDQEGRIDTAAWKRERGLCFVHKIQKGEIAERGLLVHSPGGAGGGTWRFDYEMGSGEEEAGYRFDSHRFAVGEYVSVADRDGDLHTYRVASVKPM